jgi:hypothetical protein
VDLEVSNEGKLPLEKARAKQATGVWGLAKKGFTKAANYAKEGYILGEPKVLADRNITKLRFANPL